MQVLLTGICGFAGSALARALLERIEGVTVWGVDNFIRPGSETNRQDLLRRGVRLFHGDIRCPSDFEQLPAVDWVIDAAAHPSVLIGADGRTSSRQALEHNLAGTINILEYCKARKAGLVILSTSRVYSIPQLRAIPLAESADSYLFDSTRPCPPGVSARGLTENFSTAAPVSLYGATKLASELLALEYAHSYDLPVWINRCGVLAGAGQFGTAEQGIFSYWIHAHAARRPLGYCGFGERGLQVRDALHPDDLAALVIRQLSSGAPSPCSRTLHVSGGSGNAMSLAQLTAWCDSRFGPHTPGRGGAERPYDVPWLVLDSSEAQRVFGWQPRMKLSQILEEIARHAETHPEWLRLAGA